jgi:subtilisin family serine protease
MNKLLPTLFIVCWSHSFSQSAINNQVWYQQDFTKTGNYGISLNEAYKLLAGKKSKTVVVAVIDSGIDTLQEDLKDILWQNPKEIPRNGKDDDGNGYIDDRYGWNFCGSPDGRNLDRNSHEAERVFHQFKKQFEGKTTVADSLKYSFSQWQKAKKLLLKNYEEAKVQTVLFNNIKRSLQASANYIEKTSAITNFTSKQLKQLATINPENAQLLEAIAYWQQIFRNINDSNFTSSQVFTEVDNELDRYNKNIAVYEKAPEDTRSLYIKDNLNNINDKYYGNNNLSAGSGNHGTSVAGVIGAVRNNGIGVNGIADNVRIMAIRAMPGGDEYDKDVALAIRYAVDNGAQIINMSLGKPVSPNKQMVDDAMQYAAKKNVLIIHAAGNDATDIDADNYYPSSFYLNGKKIDNLLTVGASGENADKGITAPFSNYGKKSVDLFAPGMNIFSTNAGNNYSTASGTSLAAPVVSGVAALLKSYFPKITPRQIISILLTSGTAIGQLVKMPGTNNFVPLSSLCSSGKIVNAAGAIQLAQRLYPSK